jgi:hypothetical protein
MAGDYDAGIEKLLDGVVVREVIMREFESQRRLQIRNHLAGMNRQQLAAKPAGNNAERHVHDAVDDQNPHRRKMPKQRTGEPIAERNLVVEHQKSNSGEAL